MDTKLKADVAEFALIVELLKRNYHVLKPVGDRLAYDVAIERNGRWAKIQVKHAWFSQSKSMYMVDARRTKTNRRHMLRSRYARGDFDFAILYIDEVKVFYIMPVDIFNSYASTIALVEDLNRQRPPKSFAYRERWELLNKFLD